MSKAIDAPVAADTSLSVEPGEGFSAVLVDGMLVVGQYNAERPDDQDEITFSKSEFYVLVKKYAAWAGVELVTN